MKPISKPPWTKCGKKLESACRKALYDFSMVENTPSVGVALSGGKDSLTLLALLKAISGKGFSNFSLHAIHIQDEYFKDAANNKKFMEKICQDLNINFINKKATLDKKDCYRCSRGRRKLIFEEAKKHNISTIAFGHHREDSNQTLLLNLLHKGEFASHLPKIHMQRYGVTIIRPLIYISEKEIIQFSKIYGFLTQKCRCPLGPVSKRKKTEMLIEEIERIFPNARKNLLLGTLNYGSDKAKNI